MYYPNPTLPLTLLTTSLLLPTCLAINTLKVNTTIGTIYGLINGSTPHVAQFLGIPYAEPPINSLRWLPSIPKSKAPSNESIDATKFSPSCPQYESRVPGVYVVDARNFLIRGETSEDCLTVNVWTPWGRGKGGEGEEKGLPVIVWIYGGVFQAGGGEVPYQIPSNWVERTQSHIVVGINYRVNIFGFPNAAGLKPTEQNLGLLDQRLGLEWVRSNIASFGGDPSHITIWGQSAGAMSVDLYNLAYPNDPIVSGLIMDSGTALLLLGTPDPTYSNFTFVAGNLGCGGLNATEELECMMGVEMERIEGFLMGYGDNGTSPELGFYPVVDGRTRFENATERVLSGNFTKVPAIIGTNVNEGEAIVAWNPEGPDMATATAVTLDGFLCPAVVTTKSRYTLNIPTYRYLYAGNFSNIAPRPWEGAYHGSELLMIFGTTDIAHGTSTDFELALSREMQDLWLAFMLDPAGGLEKKGWGSYEPGGEAVEFGKEGMLVGGIEEGVLEGACEGVVGRVGAGSPF